MSARRTQRDRILELLCASNGRRVPSPELARISLQYGARVKELRAAGFRIRNEIERVNGQVHGYFILESGPAQIALAAAPMQRAAGHPEELFVNSSDISSFLNHELGRGGAR